MNELPVNAFVCLIRHSFLSFANFAVSAHFPPLCVGVTGPCVSGLVLTTALEADSAAGMLWPKSVQFHCLCPIRCLFVFIYVLVCLLVTLFSVHLQSDNTAKTIDTVCIVPREENLEKTQSTQVHITHVYLSVSDER